MAVNRYNRELQAPYISQYADYKLPYAAIQNAMMSRQQRFDINQAFSAQQAMELGNRKMNPWDAEGVQKEIQGYLEGVHNTVNEKYGGDYALASKDIYDKTAQFRAKPFWQAVDHSYQQEQLYQQAKAQAQSNGLSLYDFNDSTRGKSVFGSDGSISPANYNYTTRTDQRPIYEQYFNNKMLDSYGAQDVLDQVNAANKAIAGGDDRAFLAFIKKSGRSFNNEYLNQATDQYINNGGLDYKIYKDQGFSDEEARMLVKRNMLSTSNEYKVYREDANVNKNPNFGKGGGGNTNSFPLGITPTGQQETQTYETTDGTWKFWNELSSKVDGIEKERLNQKVDEAKQTVVETNPTLSKIKNEYDNVKNNELPIIADDAVNAFIKNTNADLTPEEQDLLSGYIKASLDPENQTSGNIWELYLQRAMQAGNAILSAGSVNPAAGIISGIEDEQKIKDIRKKLADSHDPHKNIAGNITNVMESIAASPEDFGFRPEVVNNFRRHESAQWSDILNSDAGKKYDRIRKQYNNQFLPRVVDELTRTNNRATQRFIVSDPDPSGKTLKQLGNLNNQRIYSSISDIEGFNDLSVPEQRWLQNKLGESTFGDVTDKDLLFNPTTGKFELQLPAHGRNDMKIGDSIQIKKGQLTIVPNNDIQKLYRRDLKYNQKFQRIDTSNDAYRQAKYFLEYPL